jgi:putative ABC transport system permease protein
MNVWNLVLQELRHRKWNFVLGLLSVSVAVACLIGSLTLLDAHEIHTEEILANIQAQHKEALEKKKETVATTVAEREAEVVEEGKKLNDEMRKITKKLGFNILILPAEQDLNELYTQGTLSATMPEAHVKKLANSKIMTVNHLLPILTKKLDEWDGPERKQTIIVVGTRGEVPLMHRDPKKPLKGGQIVPKGTVVVGFEVQKQQKLKVGDTLQLWGKEFKVGKTYPQRGTVDDSSVWVSLEEAQTSLKKQNLVNAILALECNCATADRLAEIRKDIASILPGTQVIESGSDKALARAEARNGAKKVAQKALQQERKAGEEAIEREKTAAAADLQRENEQRGSLQEQRKSFATILIPLAVIGAAVWIGFLAYSNVRQRASEIGILRAIGLRSTHIFSIFLIKATLIGLAGSLIGYLVGFGLGLGWSELPATSETGSQLFVPGLLVLCVAISPLLSALVSWFPAMLAARQDPAIVLQGE